MTVSRWRVWPPTRALEIERGEQPEEQLSNEPRALASDIDPRYPVFGNPTTASVRANFAVARDEIEDLYRRVTALEAAGLTGTLAGDVTGAASATKVERIQNFAVAPTIPQNGQVLVWVAAVAQWVPTTVADIQPPTGIQWDGGTTAWDNGNTIWSS